MSPRNLLLSLLLPWLLNLFAAFSAVLCPPSLSPSPWRGDSVCLYTGQLSEPGEQNKGHPLCQSIRKSADRSECKTTAVKEQSLCWLSDTSTLYQECRLPQPALWLLLPGKWTVVGRWVKKSKCSLTKILLPFSSLGSILLTVKFWSKCQNSEKADSITAFQLLIDSSGGPDFLRGLLWTFCDIHSRCGFHVYLYWLDFAVSGLDILLSWGFLTYFFKKFFLLHFLSW